MPQGHLLRASARLRHGRWTIAAFVFFSFFPFPPARFPLPCFSSAVGLGSLGWVCLSSLLEGEMLSVFSSQVLAETVLFFCKVRAQDIFEGHSWREFSGAIFFSGICHEFSPV